MNDEELAKTILYLILFVMIIGFITAIFEAVISSELALSVFVGGIWLYIIIKLFKKK